ncbi:MAG: hypothetical protein OEW40_21730 [Cyclobacteriaceae bacterium]|nr:hypothetical protein [Cyclobacteriaceae bacterium]
MRCLILLSVISFFISCSENRESPVFVDYTKTLDSISAIYSKPQKGEYLVDIKSIFNKSDWDSIAFILPYQPLSYIENMNLCNIDFLMDTIKYVVGVEWNYGLLFVTRGCITSYSVVGGNPSFSEICGHSGPTVPILKRSNTLVKLVNIPGANGEQSFYFMPTNYPSEEELNDLKNRSESHQPIDSLRP